MNGRLRPELIPLLPIIESDSYAAGRFLHGIVSDLAIYRQPPGSGPLEEVILDLIERRSIGPALRPWLRKEQHRPLR